jgi:hypothetical protein
VRKEEDLRIDGDGDVRLRVGEKGKPGEQCVLRVKRRKRMAWSSPC